ncbi:hypothetical protein Bbelb_363410 [Branchiostoma belcheri]|nr:hypothetical protein Bbelb_363410 [Branchiostoma belcheri]
MNLQKKTLIKRDVCVDADHVDNGSVQSCTAASPGRGGINSDNPSSTTLSSLEEVEQVVPREAVRSDTMDSRVVLILLGTLVASGSALVCYTCSGTGDDCRKNVASMDNNTETCSSLQTRCGTTYSKVDDDFTTFSRGCSVALGCDVCAIVKGTGACKRCCKTDRCNTTSGSSTAQAQGVVALLAAAILSMLLSGKQ